jgi:hypothetical protein
VSQILEVMLQRPADLSVRSSGCEFSDLHRLLCHAMTPAPLPALVSTFCSCVLTEIGDIDIDKSIQAADSNEHIITKFVTRVVLKLMMTGE